MSENKEATGPSQSAPPTDQPAPAWSGVVTPVRLKRHRKIWIGLIVVLGAIIALVAYHREKTLAASDSASTSATADQQQVPTIKTAIAHLGDIDQDLEALGTVTPVATVNIYSQVTGIVTAVHYVEGQMIKEGDPLIDLDARTYEAQLQQAQGTLEHDQGLLAQAQLDLTRYRDAVAQDAIARQTFEDQEQTVAQYKGSVKNDAGQVAYAKTELSYCHLVAPISGRVGLRLVDPGNTIFSGSTNALVTITQLQPITVVFYVAEDNLDQLRGQIEHGTSLGVDAFDRTQQTKIAAGKLLTLDNQIDTTTGTVRFRAQFPNADLKLFPNQFVNARLKVRTLTGVTLIPSSALQHNGVGTFVYKIAGDTAKVQAIKEVQNGGDVCAVDGLAPGDTVAITGFEKLEDGVKVNVQSGAATQPAGATQPFGATQPSGGTP